MTVKELERRVQRLEQQMRELQSAQVETGRRRPKNWLAAVDKFTDNEGLLSIFAEAQKLREQDRKRARSSRAGKRKAKS